MTAAMNAIRINGKYKDNLCVHTKKNKNVVTIIMDLLEKDFRHCIKAHTNNGKKTMNTFLVVACHIVTDKNRGEIRYKRQ